MLLFDLKLLELNIGYINAHVVYTNCQYRFRIHVYGI